MNTVAARVAHFFTLVVTKRLHIMAWVALAMCIALLTYASLTSLPSLAQDGVPAAEVVAQGSAFTYQGRLYDGDGLANGVTDFRFRLFTAAQAGSQVGADVALNDVTVSDGFFSVLLDFGTSPFMGEARWLQVEVKAPATDVYTVLSPRQALTATPYALYALNGSPGPQGVAGPKGDTGDEGPPGAAGSADSWSRTGNAGTNPTDNFLGTTDNQALEIRVNNQRVYQFVPGIAPNIIGGHFQNSIAPTSLGSIIAGGGGDLGSGFIYSNTISANLATISGGGDNIVSGSGAVVGGGLHNIAGSDFSVVGGGHSNSTSFDYESNTVGGGQENTARGEFSTIAGGLSNSTLNAYTTVGGGNNNAAEAFFATVAGGSQNIASGSSSVVPGGNSNKALGDYSFAAGRRATANNPGVFVWGDSTDADFISTGSNQFVIRATGGMGVGTNGPQNQLHVVESINADSEPGAHVAQIQNSNTGTNADVLALKIGNTSGTAAASNNFVTFFNGNNTSLGAIEGNGSGSVVLVGGGNDYAEWLPKLDATEEFERGEIVGIFGGQVSRQTAGADRVMAVSTGAIVAGNDPGEENRDKYALVAFIGQVDVPVRGVVRKGDLIIPSGLSDGTGIAVASEEISAADFQQVLGQAWESSDDEGSKLIRVVVGLVQHDPTVARLLTKIEAQDAYLAELEARLVALEAQLED